MLITQLNINVLPMGQYVRTIHVLLHPGLYHSMSHCRVLNQQDNTLDTAKMCPARAP